MAVQMLGIKTKFTDDQGRPLVGGSVHTYYAGTSLPQDTFSDPELTVPNTNPVKLDDTGSANIFLKGTYRVRVFDRKGKFIEEQDNVDQLATVAEVFKNKGGLNAANERIDALTTEVNSIKEKTIVVESIADLSTIKNPKDGLRVYVKSYHAGLGKGGGYFTYDSSKADKYDGGWFFNGWVRDNVTERSVIDYGAIGNWDRDKKQGANDTEAFQRVLDSLKYAGTLRNAGLRKIIVPAGHYMIDSITLRRENRWGVHIEGFSGVTTLYFNENIEEEAAIISETESVSFSNLSLEGNLGGTWTPLDRESYGFLGRKPVDDAQLDIDVTFNNCSLYGWNTFARIEGRGFVMTGGGIGGSGALLEIHARDVVNIPYPEQKYNSLFSIEAGMRHYNIRNIRVDGCGQMIRITSGTSEDAKKLANNINNIQVIGNDIQGMDAILLAIDTECRIKNSIFGNNTFTSSFSFVPFRFSSVENTVISGNTITPNSNLSVFELESEKHNQKYSMNSFITAKNIRNLIVSDNNVVGVGATIIGTASGSAVEYLTLSNNIFPEFGTSDINATRRMLYVENPARLTNISLTNNTLSSQGESKRVFEITNADRSKIIVDGNSSNFAFRDAYKYIVLTEVRSESESFSYLSGNFIVRCWYTRGFDGYISGEVQISKATSYNTSADAKDLKIPTPSGVVSDKSNYTALYSGSANVFKSNINTEIFVDIVTSNGGCFEIKDSTTGKTLKASEFISELSSASLSFTFRYLPS